MQVRTNKGRSWPREARSVCVRSETELSEEEAEVVALVGLGSRVVVPINNMQVNNYI
jgi:hypothetical protein